MKKSLLAAAALLVLVPQVAFAAWWNPLTWFSSTETVEVQSGPVGDEQSATSPAPTETAVMTEASGADSSSSIAKLRSQINQLNQENTSLRNQLANAETKYQSCVAQGATASPSPSDNNDAQASKLRVELATLDQVDTELDRVAAKSKDDLIQFLNTERELDGTVLFPVPPKSVTNYWTYQNLNSVDLNYLHTLVDDYRTALKIDLAQYEDVSN